MVAVEWAAIPPRRSPIETWQKRIRHIRRFLRGWENNLSGKYRKERERLLSIIDFLDIKAESQQFSNSEQNNLKIAHASLNKLRREEEQKWAQRAKS